MYKYYLELVQENIDFQSGNFNVSRNSLKVFEFYSIMMPSDFRKEIYNKVIRIKGDWISLDYSESFGISYLKLKLSFTEAELNDNDQIIINDSIKELDKFIEEIKYHHAQTNSDEKSIDYNLGFFVNIKESDMCGIVNHEEILKTLQQSGIQSRLISVNGSWVDCGAGGAAETVTLFVLSTVASGITYDLLKTSLNMILQDSIIEISLFENFKFDKLRKTIIERTKSPEEELILTEMYRNPNGIILKFKTSSSEITVITNNNYVIQELKMVDRNFLENHSGNIDQLVE